MKTIIKNEFDTELPIICDICSLRLKSNLQLQNHIEKVHERKKIKCEFCELPLRDKYSLKKHFT